MKQKQRTLLILSAVALLLCACLGLLLWQNSRREAQAEEETMLACSLDAQADIAALSYTYGGQSYALQKNAEGKWQLEDDPLYTLQQSIVANMAAQMQSMTAVRRLEGADPAEFGLDAPAVTVTASAGSESKTVLFGDTNSVTGDVYLLGPDGKTVYTVSADMLAYFQYDKQGLYSGPALVTADKADMTEVSLEASALGYAPLRLNHAADTWTLRDNVGQALDQTAVASWLNHWAEVKAIATQTQGGEALAAALGEPLVQLTSTTADETETVLFWDAGDGEKAYALRSNDPCLYTVSWASVTESCLVQPESLYAVEEPAAEDAVEEPADGTLNAG